MNLRRGGQPITVSIDVDAPAATVWALVSDITTMGEWSPETTACEWLDGATGAVEGARFRGHNRNGRKRWSTTCTIVRAEPELELTWVVTAPGGLRVARWSYEIEPIGDRRCRVSESTCDLRGVVLKKVSAAVSGVEDRAAHNETGMRTTLERLKAAAEFIAA